MSKSMLIINASPRKNGTSSSFSKSLKLIADSKAISTDQISTIDFLNCKYELSFIGDLIKKADIFAIITPLYIDTLPYPLIYFLEEISTKFTEELKYKSIFVISQSGFPDPMVMDTVLNSTELFALQHQMQYLGGIRYGGGVMINGTPLDKLGKRGEFILKQFDIMLSDITSGLNISETTKSNLDHKVPKLFFRPLAMFMNYNTKKNARIKNIDPLVKIY